MKSIATLFLLLSGLIGHGQDYFALIKKNDQITYNYPSNVSITLIDAEGNRRPILKDDAFDVTGDYTVEIEVPWKDGAEIVKSDGGRLELFILPEAEQQRRNFWYETRKSEEVTYNGKTYANPEALDAAMAAKPVAVKKTITKSDLNPGTYNLSLVFSNNLIVRYDSGKISAWQNGKTLNVKGNYLVQTLEGLLKLSFEPKTGETWWVFEI